MGDELRDVDWPSGDFYHIVALYESVVEKVNLFFITAIYGFLQVFFGLRDHFATTVANLYPIYILSVGEMLADGTLRNHFVTTAMFIGRYLEKG